MPHQPWEEEGPIRLRILALGILLEVATQLLITGTGVDKRSKLGVLTASEGIFKPVFFSVIPEIPSFLVRGPFL